MAIYLKTAFKAESAVQNPEKLYREPMLMASFTATVLVLGVLLFVRMPRLENFFMPTLPQTTTPATPAPISPTAALRLPPPASAPQRNIDTSRPGQALSSRPESRSFIARRSGETCSSAALPTHLSTFPA
jgi:hypothetical protein